MFCLACGSFQFYAAAETPPHHAAVQVRADLRAARAIGMHWGTFEGLTDEPMDEPPADLARQRAQAGLVPSDFDVMAIGETRPLEAGGTTR
jgi:L-ascorbate metabolism protein UlaG (beta-lactamase superfamily)